MTTTTPTPDAPEPNAAEGAHERRMVQLAEDGLGDLFRPADPYKTVLFPAEEMPAPPPLLRSPGFKQEFGRYHSRLGGQLPPSGFYRFENVHIGFGGTIISADRKILWSADLISSYWMRFVSRMVAPDVVGRTLDEVLELPATNPIGRFLAGQSTQVQELDFDGVLVCLLKPGIRVYGHWLLDVLPMVWQLQRCAQAGALKGPFRYMINRNVSSWVLKILEMLFGITPRDLLFVDETSTMLHAREVIVPSQIRVSPLISPRMNDFVDFALERVLPLYKGKLNALPRRVFISRSAYEKMNNKLLRNNADIIRALKAEGVSMVQPETMPWPQQLAMFSRAELIVGEFGSGIHNAIFGPPTQRTIVLSHYKRNWNQSAIAAIRGQSIAYVQPMEEERTGIEHGVTYSFDPAVVAELAHELSQPPASQPPASELPMGELPVGEPPAGEPPANPTS